MGTYKLYLSLHGISGFNSAEDIETMACNAAETRSVFGIRGQGKTGRRTIYYKRRHRKHISIYQRGMHLAERATDALGHLHVAEMCDSIPQTCALDITGDLDPDSLEEFHAYSRCPSRKSYGICF